MKNSSLAFFVLLVSFLIANWLLTGHLNLNRSTTIDFVILFFSWSISLLLTQKYGQELCQKRLTYRLAPFVKSMFLILVFILVARLFLGEAFSVDVSFVTIGIFFLTEACIVVVVSFAKADFYLFENRDERSEEPKKEQMALIGTKDGTDKAAQPIDVKTLFNDAGINEKEEAAKFVSRNLEAVGALSGRWEIFCSNKPDSLKNAPLDISLLLATEQLNDVRYLNQYLLGCHQKIIPGGWLVGKYTPLEDEEKHLRGRFSGFLYWVAASLHFLFYRAFPKIPYVNRLYFAITKGKNRVVSRTEVWGRLHFCGFNVLDEKRIGNEHFIIARKVKTPSEDKHPSYYPIVKLDRVGLGGKIIKAHKIRTMYPFSEYLQKRVFEDNQLASSGKFREDFRITAYGKFLRKYWLDELPQFIDWLRGDLKLVGIRAMSKHYYSLYPPEYHELFVKVKPGLVPPLFDDSTTDFAEIVKTEWEYLKKYIEHPFMTDIQYFWKTFSSIFFNHVRGG